MPVDTTIYQSSDLNQRGRAFLDAARAGLARLRDKDGLSLVMLPERRVNALFAIANAAANLFTVEAALQTGRAQASNLSQYGEWTWLRAFDEEDLREFIGEMRQAIVAAAREESSDLIEGAVHRWRTTAEALADPLRRQILLGADNLDDYVEVSRPE